MNCDNCKRPDLCKYAGNCLNPAATEELIARRSAAACSAGWLPIDSAPKDGTEIIVYCPPAHGLNHMVSVCAYHEDAGFCVDELREPAFWIPLPNDERTCADD